MSKYKIELVHDMDAWDKFVDESPQGTIFSQSIYLKLAVHYWNIFWIKKGNQIKGGLAIILDRSKKNVILDDLVIHNGLMFVENKQQKPCSIKSEQFEITEFVIEYLIGEFDTIALSLAPSFRDLRPFLWENYHSKDDSDKFKLETHDKTDVVVVDSSGNVDVTSGTLTAPKFSTSEGSFTATANTTTTQVISGLSS